MSKLVKRLENGTDFDVCVFLLKSGKYAVTVYDNVNRTHEKQDVFDDLADALVLAKKLNKNYRIDESKTNKGMKKNVVKLNEATLKKMIAESVKKALKESILKENDEFTPHGYKTMNNYGGNEIQINEKGDAVKLKFQDGEITDWLEIEFDEDGVAYVTSPYGEKEKLSDYIRY